jgi:hypothetical protein
VARTRRDDPDDEDDYDPDDDYDADRDYDPDDPETYPAGVYADDGPATVPCPHCKAEVFEDSERCPRCGNYLSAEDAPREGKSGPWVMLMALALLAALLWVLGG